MHGLLSLHTTVLPAVQTPLTHASPLVQTVPSASQPLPSFRGCMLQTPVAAAQVLTAQKVSLALEQVTIVPPSTTQVCVLALQIRVPSHKLPFSNAAQSLVVWHWHVLAPLVQMPPEQMSPAVQLLPSSQAPVLLAWLQPLAASQLSVVQGLLSLQFTLGSMAVPTQVPVVQTSPLVQALPSLQSRLVGVWTQPLAGVQESVVQALPSSQARLPPLQTLAAQTSFWLQALPSSQLAVLAVWTQFPPLQLSSVHTLLSWQSGPAPPTQLPPAHASPKVHGSPSLQLAVLALKTQPLTGSHVSSVHGLPSSHWIRPPATQFTPTQLSNPVHTLPSASHGLPSPCPTRLHTPVAELQTLAAHAVSFAPSQLTMVATSITHFPPLQTSEPLHKSPSLLPAQSAVVWQSHVLTLPPTHLPLTHASPVVQGLPSAQAKLSSFLLVQPNLASQLGTAHIGACVHFSLTEATQFAPLHECTVNAQPAAPPSTQAMPAPQSLLSWPTWVQPLAGSQPSAVHSLPSSQFLGASPQAWLTHTPVAQGVVSLLQSASVRQPVNVSRGTMSGLTSGETGTSETATSSPASGAERSSTTSETSTASTESATATSACASGISESGISGVSLKTASVPRAASSPTTGTSASTTTSGKTASSGGGTSKSSPATSVPAETSGGAVASSGAVVSDPAANSSGTSARIAASEPSDPLTRSESGEGTSAATLSPAPNGPPSGAASAVVPATPSTRTESATKIRSGPSLPSETCASSPFPAVVPSRNPSPAVASSQMTTTVPGSLEQEPSRSAAVTAIGDEERARKCQMLRVDVHILSPKKKSAQQNTASLWESSAQRNARAQTAAGAQENAE